MHGTEGTLYLVLVHCQYSPVARALGLGCYSRSTSTGEDPFVKVFFAGSSVQNMENLYYYPSIQHISVLKFVPSLHSDPTLNYTTN